MGSNCCGSGQKKFTSEQIQQLVRIQSAMKGYLARRKKKQLRDIKVQRLFSVRGENHEGERTLLIHE